METSFLQEKCSRLKQKNRKLQQQLKQLSQKCNSYRSKNKRHKRTISELHDFRSHELPNERSATRLKRHRSSYMFECFLIIGEHSGGVKVLDSFPQNPGFSEEVLSAFAFPSGFSTKSLDLSKSNTAFYSLFYSAIERDEKSYVFMLRSAQADYLYGCCVIENEPINVNIVPKCYCLLSSVPCFSLHFQVLYTYLSIKKAHKLSEYSYGNLSTSMSFEESSLLSEQKELLEKYRRFFLMKNWTFHIELNSVPNFEYTFPNDLSLLDTEWACSVLFSLLNPDQIFSVLCAALTERRIVFQSENLGYLSGCVLGIVAVIKPFKWQHFVAPILPDIYNEMLEAPVPFIIGLPSKKTIDKKGILIVNLDDKKVRGKTPIEPRTTNLKERINKYWKYLDETSCFSVDQRQMNAVLKIAKRIQAFVLKIIKLVPRIGREVTHHEIDFMKKHILSSVGRDDWYFMNALLNTQMFAMLAEEINNNSNTI